MRTKKCSRVTISVYEEQWTEFFDLCNEENKSASGVVRELVANWVKERKREEREKRAMDKTHNRIR